MRIISEKKKNKIGKRLSAIYYIALHGYGSSFKDDLDCTSKIIEHIYEIAYAVGGRRFSDIEIPTYVKHLQDMQQEVRDGDD